MAPTVIIKNVCGLNEKKQLIRSYQFIYDLIYDIKMYNKTICFKCSFQIFFCHSHTCMRFISKNKKWNTR